MDEAKGPTVTFVIGGVQKAGTTALAHCLKQHPDVLLPRDKEAHVFDAPDFDDTWTRAEVDQRYRSRFDKPERPVLAGDATPIYCLHERFVERIARYNPAMRWILLLRDPVERAISHYYMERDRGNESLALWPAMLCEGRRLRGHRNDFSLDSPLRTHSYCLRGLYSRQMDVLKRHFCTSQLLILRSEDFKQRPEQTLQQVYAHLGLEGPVRLPGETRRFAGHYVPPGRASALRLFLAWRFRHERSRLRRHHGLVLDGTSKD